MRVYALRALGRSGAPEAFAVIEAALKESNDNVRHNAMVSLGELHDGRALDILLRLLEEADGSTRCSAAAGLGELGDQRALPGLRKALKDDSELVRRSATLALARLKDSAVFERLLGALEKDVDGLQGSAPWALGELGDKRAVPPLVTLVQDKARDINDRNSALRALGKLGDPAAVEPLLRALDEKDSTVRKYAAESLGALGDKRALKPLQGLLVEEDDSLRAAASEAVKKIQAAAQPTSQPASRPEAGPAEIDRLIEQLGSSTFAQREAAQAALIKIGPPAYAALKVATGDSNLERAGRASTAAKVIGRSFAIYVVEEQPGPSAMARPLAEPKLAPEPVLTGDDIVSYDWHRHSFVFKAEAKDRLPHVNRMTYFVVVANGQRCYAGGFTGPKNPPQIFIGLNLDLEGNQAENLELAIGWLPDGGRDPRDDQRIHDVLKTLGKLKESASATRPGP